MYDVRYKCAPPTNIAQSREIMLTNNPMKNPKVVEKVAAKNRGKVPSNKIQQTYTKICKECEREEIKPDTAHNRLNIFCGKSCAASWSNRNRPHKKGYTFKRKSETKPRNFIHERFVNARLI